jgi:hypothetical protein
MLMHCYPTSGYGILVHMPGTLEIIKSTDIKPWERQPHDTDRAFEAFEVYRALGTSRSLAKAAERLGKSTQLLERWSKRDRWLERVYAYDRHEARAVNEAVYLGTAEMRKRMVNQALGMQARAQQRIIKMTDEEIGQLKPTEILGLMRVAADMERKARDIPEDQFAFAEVPSFEIQVIHPAGQGMVGVQMQDGRVGYIPLRRVDDFRRDYPDALVLT